MDGRQDDDDRDHDDDDDHHDIEDRLGLILVNQRRIIQLLDRLTTNQETIMTDLSSLTAAVANETTVEASAIALLTQLAADIAAAGTDPVALQTIVDNINTNSAALAASVTANTPAAPAPPA